MKRIWFMILFMFCVIYSQEDTLRVTSTSGESHEIVLGISQGMSYYLENMLFSYDTSGALVPDSEGIRLLRESGIRIIRFWIDDWKEYIGPPDSNREGSSWFYDSSLGYYGYIFSTGETLYIPPHASHPSGFNYGLKQLQMLYDEAGIIFAPVYEYIQDTSICHGLTVDSTICWDVYNNAVELMEYLFGDPTKSLWAKFRVEVDSVPKYSPEAFHLWTLTNDLWTGNFWGTEANIKKSFQRFPGYYEYITWNSFGKPINDFLNRSPYFRYNYVVGSDTIDSLRDADVWVRVRTVRGIASCHELMRRINGFKAALESVGVADSVKLVFAGVAGNFKKDSVKVYEYEDSAGDRIKIYKSLPLEGYYTWQYSVQGSLGTDINGIGFYFPGGTFTDKNMNNIMRHVILDSFPDESLFFLDTLYTAYEGTLKNDTIFYGYDTLFDRVSYRESYPRYIMLYKEKLKERFNTCAAYADTFGHPDYPIFIIEWNIWGYNYSQIGGFGVQTALNAFLESDLNVKYVMHHEGFGGWFGLFQGFIKSHSHDPDACEYDSIYISPQARVHGLYAENLKNEILDASLAYHDSFDFEGLYKFSQYRVTSTSGDTMHVVRCYPDSGETCAVACTSCIYIADGVYLPDSSGIPYWEYKVFTDGLKDVNIILSNRDLDSSRWITIDLSGFLDERIEGMNDTITVRTVMVDDSIVDICRTYFEKKGRPRDVPTIYAGHHICDVTGSAVMMFDGVGCGPCGTVSCDEVCEHWLKDTMGIYGKFVQPISSVDTVTPIILDNETFRLRLPKHSVSLIEVKPNWRLSLKHGWNLISLPIDTDVTVRSIFPTSVVPDSVVYIHGADTFNTIIKYDPTGPVDFPYRNAMGDIVDPSEGYWIFAKKDTTMNFDNKVCCFEDTLIKGWNLVGSIRFAKYARDMKIYDTTAYIVSPNYFFDPYSSYETTDIIYPFYGHWLLSSGTTSVAIDCSGIEHPESSASLYTAEVSCTIDVIIPSQTSIVIGFDTLASWTLDTLFDKPYPPIRPGIVISDSGEAFLYRRAPVATQLKTDIVHGQEIRMYNFNLYLLGADSFGLAPRTIPDRYGVNVFNDDRCWRFGHNDTIYLEPGIYTIQLDPKFIPDLLLTMSDDPCHKALMNVAPGICEPDTWCGIEGSMFCYALDDDDSTYDLSVKAFRDYDYYDAFELYAIDYDTMSFCALYNGEPAFFRKDSLKSLNYAVSSHGDTIYDEIKYRDGWFFTDDSAGFIEFKLPTQWMGQSGAWVIFDYPPADCKGDTFSHVWLKYWDPEQEEWITCADAYGRIESPPACGKVVNIGQVDSVKVRVEWNISISIDQIAIVPDGSPDASYITKKQALSSAIKNDSIDVTAQLQMPDESYVALDSGDVLELSFTASSADTPASGYNRAWYFKVYGKQLYGFGGGSPKISARRITDTIFTRLPLADVDNNGILDRPNICSAGIRFYRIAHTGTSLLSTHTVAVDTCLFRSLSFTDFNNDGFPDMFISADTASKFYSNNGTNFIDITSSIDLDLRKYHVSYADFADLDNDLDIDLVLACKPGPILVLLNNGGLFEVSDSICIHYSGRYDQLAIVDVNSDGNYDIMVTGYPGDASVFLAESEGSFKRIGWSYWSGEAATSNTGFKIYLHDLDNDGDVDFKVKRDTVITQFINFCEPSDWLEVEAEGAGPYYTNSSGVGVKVVLYDGGITKLSEISGGYRQNIAVFSWENDIDTVDSARIIWTNSCDTMIRNLILVHKFLIIQDTIYGSDTTFPKMPKKYTKFCDFYDLRIFPNVFNSSCVVEFYVPFRQNITLSVYDVLGRFVDMLYSGEVAGGNRSFTWSPLNMPSNIYLFKLSYKNGRIIRRGILLK